VQTTKNTKDTSLLSNFPIMGGLYDVTGKEGVYYEVTVRTMKGVIAVGSYRLFSPPVFRTSS
jgi:hypothetical protein